MKATIILEVEDDTTAEKMAAAGITEAQAKAMYYHAFSMLLHAVALESAPGARHRVAQVTIEDNTKEART